MTQIKPTQNNKNTTPLHSALGPDQNRAQQSTTETPRHSPRQYIKERKNWVIREREQGLLGEWRIKEDSSTVCLHAAADQHMLSVIILGGVGGVNSGRDHVLRGRISEYLTSRGNTDWTLAAEMVQF